MMGSDIASCRFRCSGTSIRYTGARHLRFRGIMRTCILFTFLASILAMPPDVTLSADREPAQANAKFSVMEDQFIKESLALSPVNASQAGYHKHVDAKSGKTIMLDAELDDLSPAAIKTQVDFYHRW